MATEQLTAVVMNAPHTLKCCKEGGANLAALQNRHLHRQQRSLLRRDCMAQESHGKMGGQAGGMPVHSGVQDAWGLARRNELGGGTQRSRRTSRQIPLDSSRIQEVCAE